MEIRIACANLIDAVFAHKYRCMQIMNQITANIR